MPTAAVVGLPGDCFHYALSLILPLSLSLCLSVSASLALSVSRYLVPFFSDSRVCSCASLFLSVLYFVLVSCLHFFLICVLFWVFSSCWCLFFICLVMLCISMYIIAIIFSSLFSPQLCSCLLSTPLSFRIHLPSLLLPYILTIPLFSVFCIFLIIFHSSPVASSLRFLSCQILEAYLKRLVNCGIGFHQADHNLVP